MVVTRIKVRNTSNAPIARLTIAETWIRQGGATVGAAGVINGLLQPGEVQTVVIETPLQHEDVANNYNFSHANARPQAVARGQDDG